MSGLNGKHLASDNQLLNCQPSRAPNGCAQLGGAAFPAEFTVNPTAPVSEPSPWLAAQCPTCGVKDLSAGHSRRLPPLFSLLWWGAGERQAGKGNPFPCHRGVQAFDVCLDDGRFLFQMEVDGKGLSCRVGTGRCSISEPRCCSFHESSLLSGTRWQILVCMEGV